MKNDIVFQNPPWLIEAFKHDGEAEIPGPQSNVFINKMWLSLPGGAWFWKTYGDDGKLPWCGAFVAHCLKSCGIAIPKLYASAKAWAEWGSKLSAPEHGCIVVFDRKGGGHVGFVVGRTRAGNLMVLGGNQGDKVCIRPFERSRVVGYYWPPGLSLPNYEALAMMDAAGVEPSTNEA